MVKSQTDEFIKSNTSACNTPHKIHHNTIETDVTEPLLHDNKKNVIAVNVGGSTSINDGNNGNKSGKGEMRFTKRQISRELFNQDGNQCSDKNDNDNNRTSNFHNESKGRGGGGGGNRQFRKTFFDSSSASFSEIQSPQIAPEYPITQFTSTPGNNSATCTNQTIKVNKSMDGGEYPTNTSTPNSFFNTKSSLSFDQSSMVNRGCGNSTRRSVDANSGYKNKSRNTSSPFCLGDFLNTSNASNTSGRGNKKKNQSGTTSDSAMTPKFNSSDFPTLKQNVNNSNEGKMQQQQAKSSNEIGKPKKRVMPITVSRRVSTDSPIFVSSSFQSENNLLGVTTLEADESIPTMPEREMLREHRDTISKDFDVEHKPIRNLHTLIRENLPASPISLSSSPVGHNPFTGSLVSTPHKSILKYDEGKVERKDLLMAMARIYSFLIDANHVPNILSEFSYIVNLLNTEYNPYEHQMQNYTHIKSSIDIASNILKNFHNCIFFIMCILNHQKQILAMLDCTTIRVICDYERIQTITPSLYEYLRNIMQKKMQIDSAIASQRVKSDTNNINKVVFYQQETDNRDNFPSDREFGAFKKQRDMFYTILRSWELKHLDPSWDFRRELGAKVRGLLTLLEHPINMAHLAKLFTAQLIISCNFDNELQMALPNIDLSKLSKLRQRLVAPSLFSTQYLFPGNQAFFRDFIICCDFHMMFIEQLKIALISELLQMNDSSIETLSITRGNVNNNTAASTSNDDDDDNKEKCFQQEFIVRAETISTMRVIGKFIGFVVSRLYSYDGYRNSLVDQKQMSIRNLIRPDFDVKSIVHRAINGRKLLVTIPWLVEYLTMLDFITIRLDYYREVFQILYTLYMRINTIDGHDIGVCVMPQSKFIIRACLGWLFEHPSIPEDYYNSNMMINLNVTTAQCITSNEPVELNPHLENAIHSSCPFLADFRVSMMPQRMTKAVSRTGRYRHITTKIQDKSSTSVTNMKTQGNHERLVEAFLASQSLSVRKIVDFTIDRVTSAVIKDFQVRHVLSIRKEARICVEMEVPKVKNVDSMKKKMREIFYQHYERLLNQWNDDILSNCKSRIESSFDALLPIETLNDVKKTLINITIEKTNAKLEHWRTTNISIEIFSKDIHVDAIKLMESHQQQIGNSTTNKRTSSNMIIDLSAEIHPSEYFQSLQMQLHRASLHAEKIDENDIIKLLDLTGNVLDKQILPTNAYRNIAFYILQLVLLLIANRPELITKEFLTKLFIVWHHEKLLNFTTSLRQENKKKDGIEDDDEELKSTQNNRLKVNNFIFCNVISTRFILTMQGKNRKNFEAYGYFLIELIKEQFITVDDVNELSVGLYKHEWSKNTLDDIAFLIQHVKSFLPSSDDSAQSHLFMELVADLAREMENF
ncbi:protein disks lost [Chironomus tepperi]|uniref:protein disks lost n=1 Tax=Chironomus tepperi TaxID=113505 RepID=UPI00391F0CBC